MELSAKWKALRLCGVACTAALVSFFLMDQGTANGAMRAEPVEPGEAEQKGETPLVAEANATSTRRSPLGAEEEARDPASRAARLKARDPEEWQGMQVDLTMQALCEGPASCGLAMACLDGKCGPCTTDGDCAQGESCVLDHCVLESNAACKTRDDCADDELCVLSGYSSDPRGNAEMKATCLGASGGTPQVPDETEEEQPVQEPQPTPFEVDQMREEVRKLLQAPAP